MTSIKNKPAAAATAKSLQSYPTLCDPIDGSPPGFPVPRILQARTLEWVAISFSNARKWKVKVKSLSRIWLLATPWTAAHQASQPMGFSRQEYWSGVPLPSPKPATVENFKFSETETNDIVHDCAAHIPPCLQDLCVDVQDYCSFHPPSLQSCALIS